MSIFILIAITYKWADFDTGLLLHGSTIATSAKPNDRESECGGQWVALFPLNSMHAFLEVSHPVSLLLCFIHCCIVYQCRSLFSFVVKSVEIWLKWNYIYFNINHINAAELQNSCDIFYNIFALSANKLITFISPHLGMEFLMKILLNATNCFPC